VYRERLNDYSKILNSSLLSEVQWWLKTGLMPGCWLGLVLLFLWCFDTDGRKNIQPIITNSVPVIPREMAGTQ